MTASTFFLGTQQQQQRTAETTDRAWVTGAATPPPPRWSNDDADKDDDAVVPVTEGLGTASWFGVRHWSPTWSTPLTLRRVIVVLGALAHTNRACAVCAALHTNNEKQTKHPENFLETIIAIAAQHKCCGKRVGVVAVRNLRRCSRSSRSTSRDVMQQQLRQQGGVAAVVVLLIVCCCMLPAETAAAQPEPQTAAGAAAATAAPPVPSQPCAAGGSGGTIRVASSCVLDVGDLDVGSSSKLQLLGTSSSTHGMPIVQLRGTATEASLKGGFGLKRVGIACCKQPLR